MDPHAETPRWQAVYVHPDKPHVEVTLKTSTEPAPRRMFLIAGGPTLLHLSSVEPINNTNTTKESDVHMANTQARKRPKKKSGTRRAAPEPEVTEDDLDGLDDLDIDDLDDLDLEDDVDVDDLDDESDEDDDDPEDEDDIEEDEDEEIEDEEEDDLGDLDDLDEDEEDEPEPAPARKRSSGRKASSGRTRAPVKEAPATKPLTEAQSKMLKAAVKNKTGAKVENIGQKRTAEALMDRGLVKWVPRTDNTRVTATSAGKKYDPAAPAPAAKPPSKRASASKSTGNGVPKGMVGVAKIADVCKVHEETVRRVLRMNEDRFPKDEDHGRYLFTKDDAREVIREVKAYTKYTGGSRGRPVGARTELPEGKVGPQWIADEAGVHRNTVYKFLRKHEERFERYISEDGLLWVFPEGVAQKIADKLGA